MDEFPFDLPPILPDITDDLRNFIINPERLPIHQYERNQEFWPREPKPMELLNYELAPLSTTLKVRRDPFTGKILDFVEVSVQDPGADAKNSMSLNRAPAPPSEATRGNALYIPFWPASFPEPIQQTKTAIPDSEFLTIPPGFSRGIAFDKDGRTVLSSDQSAEKETVDIEGPNNVINLLEIVKEDQEFFGSLTSSVTKALEPEDASEEHRASVNLPEEDDVLPNDAPILNISSAPPPAELTGTEWAILLDTSKPVRNFKEKIPNMAYEFPFELDTFQKLAILQLEQHNHVFVAAHTSAGKTVVAEYAIALSQKHMTRTIYTSPIKALSNQKYRDFKRAFKDVGLITGDVQINQTAACLIMTTEILRSMLYCGSDVTRDLEYVIFDEVHYINDRERGHVWEQVLILLPAHVCVVLLSATVPNTIQFADWLGQTHKRKVYVITTYKRPVPLMHYLYTGTGGASRDNRFLVLNSDGWKIGGYSRALDSIPKPDPKSKFPYVKTQYQYFTPKQERQLWIGLVSHLSKNSLLPIVAFTFSRAKCDQNAEGLMNVVDLTTQKEKSQIHMFFEKCVKSLKEPDREIPQILMMRQILQKGVGVHHSGVLPIIKEIVEMLFQNGLIKLLFATETFAMGVNMPARTVVFDSITKHDGKERRNLKPAEYIQMAGRAGRRGLDSEGTVIILCKNKIPGVQELQAMMMGNPNILESQFRLTYGMVLSLLRVESLSVEGMMSRSFHEADHQKKMVDLEIELKDVENQLSELCVQELSNYLQPLVKFYESASTFINARQETFTHIITCGKLAKTIVPGRLLLITYKHHINKLALLCSLIRGKTPTYKVLVLTDTDEAGIDEKTDLWYKMIALSKDSVFVPTNSPSHEVLVISPEDIFEITDKTLKIDTELVMRDWDKRQIERFKNDPIGQTCQQAIQELYKLSMGLSNELSKNKELGYLHLLHDLKVNEQDLHKKVLNIYELKDKLIDHMPSTQIPNFEQQFASVFKRTYLEKRKKELQHLLSSESLTLYPDYENRIELLRRLNYVDSQIRVQLKGRVACEMGMNELLITELVLRNILTKLKPAQVAALLSALVFAPKKGNEEDEIPENIPEELKKAISDMKQIHCDIANLEMELQIRNDEFQNYLNFALVEIVYEWASAKPFVDIMMLTDIQEGIIVRCIQQLNDIICDVRNAARIIGDPELQSKMEEASAAIKRDIVFAASLYTNDV